MVKPCSDSVIRAGSANASFAIWVAESRSCSIVPDQARDWREPVIRNSPLKGSPVGQGGSVLALIARGLQRNAREGESAGVQILRARL